MARTLTDPITQPVITKQAITDITFRIPHTSVYGEPTEVVIDTVNIQVTYNVSSYCDDGSVDHIEDRTVFLADWPIPFKDDVKAMYAKLAQDAEAQGLIDPGIDDPLE